MDTVKFVGVTKVIDKGDMSSGLATQPSGCKSILLEPFCLFTKSHLVYDTRTLDHIELARDVVRIKVYYYRRGYRETEVDTLVSRAKNHTNLVRVTFRVTEGKPVLVKSLAVEQPDYVLARDAERAVLVRSGKPLNLVELDTTHARLRNALWDKGYADAESPTLSRCTTARARRTSPSGRSAVDRQGRIGDRTRRFRALARHREEDGHAQAGKHLQAADVIESQQSLYNSNLYRRATIVLPPRGDSAKLIDIDLAESRLHSVRLSAGFSTIDFIQTEGKFTNYNWLGDARRLDLHLVVSNLLAPALNGTGIFRDVLADNGLPGTSSGVSQSDLSGEYRCHAALDRRSAQHGRSRPLLAPEQPPGIYIDKGYGASISFTRNVAAAVAAQPRLPVRAHPGGRGRRLLLRELRRLRATHHRTAAQSQRALARVARLHPGPHGRRAQPDGRLHGPRRISSTRRSTRSPISGYNRASGEGTAVSPARQAVLAGHIRGGWVKALHPRVRPGTDGLNEALHPRKRFYAGGANSVRGYGENQLGPRILTVDPAKLIATGCTHATIADGSCDPNTAPSK